jgi:hypothetical protein
MYERAKYKPHTSSDWRLIRDPVATLKRDGGNYFMPVQADGSVRFYSRRESVKGGFPDRTDQLPQFANVRLPQHAGNVYNVELIHTGKSPNFPESPTRLAGILNSGKEKSISSQSEHGPVRAVLHNVISGPGSTYSEKMGHLQTVAQEVGMPDLLWVDPLVTGHGPISDLIDRTKREGREGVIVTSLTAAEHSNPRVKIVHRDHFNLKVVGMEEERDKHGVPKGTMGALLVADRTGAIVGKVGTGFLREDRVDAMKNWPLWKDRLIQVSARGFAKNALKGPCVYHGDADGGLDLVIGNPDVSIIG